MAEAGPGSTALHRGSPSIWLAVPALLGATGASLQVSRRVTEDYWNWGIEQDPASLAFTIAPFLIVLLAVRPGGPRAWPGQAGLLVLSLIGPLLLALNAVHGPGGFELVRRLGDWLLTPASIGAVAGILGGLRGDSKHSYGALAIGGLTGFLMLAVPLNQLGIGNWADCPPGTCDVLQMKGILGGVVVVGLIGAVVVTPAFIAGALAGRVIGRPPTRGANPVTAPEVATD